jgi:hypothetical protein
MNDRFSNVIDVLVDLKRTRPECMSEVDVAIQMIKGRPGIEAKYDALLLKLDREFSRIEDDANYWEEVSKKAVLHRTRLYAKQRCKTLRKLARNFQWMRARNTDMIKIDHQKV